MNMHSKALLMIVSEVMNIVMNIYYYIYIRKNNIYNKRKSALQGANHFELFKLLCIFFEVLQELLNQENTFYHKGIQDNKTPVDLP